jgi:putative pyruvate formate lyase activating enzyme
MAFTPSYIALHESGELRKRADTLEAMLEKCTLCPHNCGNNRLQNELARCHSGRLPIVSSACRHFGEEPALGGLAGVGNIFFSNCTLQCVFCQNHQISQNWKAEQKNEISIESLADMMLELQKSGARAIGFVTPGHFAPQIVRAVDLAASCNLNIPLIYNTNGFDSVEVLRLLEGIIDIYLPDMKYGDDEAAYRYSGIRSYVEISRAAIKEMYRQTGSDLILADDGLLLRGLIIRHLVLPNDLALTGEVFRWIAAELDSRLTISVMSQYYPAHKAQKTELLDRTLRPREYDKVLEIMHSVGLQNGWTQEYDSCDHYQPDFANTISPFPTERNSA